MKTKPLTIKKIFAQTYSRLGGVRRVAMTLLVMLLTTLMAVAANTEEPRYNIDYVKSGTGWIFTKGWSVDKTYPDWEIGVDVSIYKDEACSDMIIRWAGDNVYRADKNAQYGITGNHGFDFKIPISGIPYDYPEGVYEHTFYLKFTVTNSSRESFAMNETPIAVTVRKLLGSGEPDNPFLICNAGDWDSLADDMADDVIGDFYTDKYYELVNETWAVYDNTTAVTKMWGIHPFTGHFDGNGKTLNVSLNGDAITAPFITTNGATIQNLTVSGTINTVNVAGGIVGYDIGGGTLTLRNCVCSAAISGFGYYAGGLVGTCGDLTLNIRNCLFKGSFTPRDNGKYHPIALKNATATVNARGVVNAMYVNTITPSEGLGDNAIDGAEGTPVNTSEDSGSWDEKVTASDGQNYYATHFTGKRIPYSYTFENPLDEEGWTLIDGATNTVIKPESSPNYLYVGVKNSQYLISPEFDGSTAITFSFRYAEAVMSSGITTKIQVGYSTNSKDINAFTWCDVIALYTTWQWLYFEKDFPKNVRYIALRFFDMSHEVEVKDFSFQHCDYPPPAYITVSELADKDATLSWEEPDAEYPISGYSYQYKKASDELWSYETSTTVASAVLDNLLPNMDYNFRMKTNYKDGGTSRYIATNFTTDLQLPYDCGFENGWERWSLVGATERTTIATRNHHDGENAFRFSNYGSDHPQYLISPPFSAVTGMRVSFFHLARGVEKSTFEIGYSVTNSTLSEFTWVESVQSQYNEWKKYERVFPVGTKYIALKYSHVDSNNVQDICLDDFIFDEYTGYAPPAQLSVSSLTDQTVTLTWTAPESATGYAYQYRILGEALWSTITTQTGTSVTVGGLQPNTTFDFRVRALYPNDNHSRFETIRVATDNVALTLPFTDSFENGMGGWRLSDHAESTMITQNAAQTGNNGFCIFHSETQSQTLISPLLDCQNSELAVLFYAKNPYSQIRPASFQVGYSTTSRNLSEFTWVTPYICASSNWTQLAGHFPAGTKYFAIMVIQDTGVLYLDDFTFTSAINPAVPQQLAVTDVTATSADISWTGNTETFNLRYRQKPLFFEDFEKGLGQWTVVRNGQGTTNTDWQHGDIYGNNTFSAVSFNYERYDETHNTLYSVDNWLISPKLTLNNTLKFNGLYVSLTSSEFDVLVSTTTKDISAFAKIGSWGSTDDINSDMSLYSCDLSSYNGAEGYIAFRHKNNVSGSWLAIEDVGIFVGDHNWTTKAVSGNHLTVTGLQPLANYEFHVRGTLPYNTSDWTDVAYFATNNDLYLADNADNTEAIAACATSAAEGKTLDVTLQDRTLWKDGKWNTLCLPFTMTAEQVAAQLAPKELKELDLADDGTYTHATGLDGSTLYLNFKDATKITAGVPYIIRWDATTPNYIENPVFTGVTINAAAPAPVATTDGKVSFVGSYSPVALTPNDDSNLFIGTNNTLFWPNAANNADGKYYVNACRAYFHVDPSASVREFRLNFGEEEASGIENVKLKIENEAGAWYDLQGRKVKDHGTRNSEFRTRNSELHKGLYIHNGRKVVIK